MHFLSSSMTFVLTEKTISQVIETLMCLTLIPPFSSKLFIEDDHQNLGYSVARDFGKQPLMLSTITVLCTSNIEHNYVHIPNLFP
uniref:Uncharacterized protein n=1 Tax=Rhizophora mucronata TaxID=61149 RepID=A0A2P2QM76_RHIMU